MKSIKMAFYGLVLGLSACTIDPGFVPTSYDLPVTAVRLPRTAEVNKPLAIEVDYLGSECDARAGYSGANPSECYEGNTDIPHPFAIRSYQQPERCKNPGTAKICFIPRTTGVLRLLINHQEYSIEVR
jgi:hypothetical protein